MLELCKAFAGIATRRLGPEDLPASAFLIALVAVAYLVTQLPSALMLFGQSFDALRIMAIDLGLIAVAFWLLLAIGNRRARYAQTLAAALGTRALIGVMILPLLAWRGGSGEPMASSPLPGAFLLALLLWSFVIDGHIISRALSKPFLLGVVIAIGLFFLQREVLFGLVPVPA